MQTSVSATPPIGTEGAIVDTRPYDTVSRLVSDEATASAGFDAGIAVVTNPALDNDDQVRAPDAASLVLEGVAVLDKSAQQRADLATDTDFVKTDGVTVLRKGVIWVRPETAVTKGAPAFFRFSSGAGGSRLGAWRTDADTATAEAAPGCFFATSAGAGELAQLEVNLPAS